MFENYPVDRSLAGQAASFELRDLRFFERTNYPLTLTAAGGERLALRFALPGLGNLWQVALKDSSLISVTGLAELMRVSQVGAGSTHRPFAFYLGGAALYLVMTLATTRIFDVAEARATRGMRRATG